MSKFMWINAEESSDNFVTIDSQRRFYVSTGACNLIGVDKTGLFSLFIGYDPVNERIIVAKPEIVKAVDTKPFTFDSRRYSNARPIIIKAAIPVEELPLKYEYRGRDFSEYPDGAHVFQLMGSDAPDDKGTETKLVKPKQQRKKSAE